MQKKKTGQQEAHRKLNFSLPPDFLAGSYRAIASSRAQEPGLQWFPNCTTRMCENFQSKTCSWPFCCSFLRLV